MTATLTQNAIGRLVQLHKEAEAIASERIAAWTLATQQELQSGRPVIEWRLIRDEDEGPLFEGVFRWSRSYDRDTVHIPLYVLGVSDEAFKQECDKRLAEHQRKTDELFRKAAQETERKEEERDRAEYARLQAKYGGNDGQGA